MWILRKLKIEKQLPNFQFSNPLGFLETSQYYEIKDALTVKIVKLLKKAKEGTQSLMNQTNLLESCPLTAVVITILKKYLEKKF